MFLVKPSRLPRAPSATPGAGGGFAWVTAHSSWGVQRLIRNLAAGGRGVTVGLY